MGSGDETNPLHTVVAPSTKNIHEQVACWPSADLYFASQLSIKLATETLILLIHSDSCRFFHVLVAKGHNRSTGHRPIRTCLVHVCGVARSKSVIINSSSVLRTCMCVQHSAVHTVVAGGNVYNWISFVGCRNLHLPLFSRLYSACQHRRPHDMIKS